MTEYSEIINQTFGKPKQQARLSAATAVEDDPEQAARAIELGDATGVNPSVIYGDIESFDKNNKSALAGHIIENNRHLQDYINSHPLAAKVSNDDWAKLDTISEKLSKLSPITAIPHAAIKAMPDIIDVAKEGLHGITSAPSKFFGSVEETDQEKEDQQKIIDFMVKNGADPGHARVEAHLLQRRKQKAEALTGALFGPATILASPIFGAFRHFIAKPIEEQTGFPKEAVENYAMVALATLGFGKQLVSKVPGEVAPAVREVVEAIEPYLRAGEEPPVGVHPVIDLIKTEQAKLDIKNLDEAFSEAQSSNTRERSAELFSNFVKQHTEAKIGVAVDALQKLYGSKEPHPEDNLFGWLPDIADRIREAEATGSDVEIPLADWLTKVSPEVAKELHDDIRMRPGGVTLNEAKELKPAELKEEKGAELDFQSIKEKFWAAEKAYKDYVAGNVNQFHVGDPKTRQLFDEMQTARAEVEAAKSSVITTVRTQAGLDPLFQEGPIQNLRIKKIPGIKAAGEAAHNFKINDEKGREVGELMLSETQGGKGLYVEWIGGHRNVANTKGGTDNIFTKGAVRDLFRQLRDEFPNAEYIEGDRISGARAWSGKGSEVVRIPIKALRDELSPEEWKRFEELFGQEWVQFGDGAEALIPNDTWSKYEQPIIENVQDVLDKIVPNHVESTPARKVTFEGREVKGLHLQYPEELPLIIWSLATNDPIGTAKHEALHHLRQYGFFTEKEWSTLEDAAIANDWASKYDIERRYPGAKFDLKLEESIAEEFAEWAREPKPEHPLAKIFQKIKDLLDQIRLAIKDALGFEPTWKDLFNKAESGEIGSREGTGPINPGSFKPRAQEKEPELPGLTRQEDLDLFEKARDIGMNAKQYKRYQELIAKRDAEDVEAQLKRALKEEERHQTKEWKENEARVRGEVRSDIENRPDIAVSKFLREGVLYGETLNKKYRLNSEKLTKEQLEALPDHLLSKSGIDPDDVAGLFGYQSGETMVNKLIEQVKAQGDIPFKKYLDQIVEQETSKRMEREFGDLDQNILSEAKDHVLSTTQMDLLHEETVALGMRAGSEMPFGKEDVKTWIKTEFGKARVGGVKVDKYLESAGRAGRLAELALLDNDPADAFKQKQRQYFATLLAREAKKFEKEQDRFERTAKQFSKREVAIVPQEYTNFIHDILMRVGQQVRRSVQDLRESIAHGPYENLESFVAEKEAGLREVPVAEFLFDSAFRKPLEELSVNEFRAVHDSVKALVTNGRAEKKILKAGEEADLAEVKGEMVEQLKEFKERKYNASETKGDKIKHVLRTFLVSHLQLESLLNRWDRGNPRGLFSQYVMRGLSDAATHETDLERKYSKELRAIADKVDLDKKIDNPIFVDPLSRTETDPDGILLQLTRKNLRAILQNVGNKSNLDKLARGYEVDPQAILDWVNQHATKEDWDWAQKQGDIFASIKAEADVMYRGLTGIEPESIEISPIQTPHGTYQGWYHPIVYDPIREGSSKKLMGGDVLEQDNYIRATTPRGYTKQRTGYAAPLSLDLDMTPSRMKQMLHDIAFRPEIINASKIFYDHDVRAAITKHYGVEYRDLLIPYLRDVANAANYRSDVARVGTKVSEFLRQNIIATFIGFNPGTVMKHGPTALVNSITEVGPVTFVKEGATEFAQQAKFYFLKAVNGLFSTNFETGETNWQFALKTSSELARRHRHYVETLRGANEEVLGTQSLRDTIIKVGAWPVAMSDLMSAVPTWMARYEMEMRAGAPHGDAVSIANTAVRRAHGSSVITNRPAVMRGGPMAQWMSSLYGFFSHIFNRQYEMMWKAGDTLGLVKEGEYKEAAKKVPQLTWMFMSYVLFPALIEELVSPLSNDEKESWGKKAAKGLAKGVSSSWIGIRDIAHAALSGHDPAAGLMSTFLKTGTDLYRDFSKIPMNKQKAGDFIQHGATAFGALTGMANAQMGKTGKFVYNYTTGQEKPRGWGQWWHGLRYGTTKEYKR